METIANKTMRCIVKLTVQVKSNVLIKTMASFREHNFFLSVLVPVEFNMKEE